MKVSDFRQGQRVQHSSMGEGVVEVIMDGAIHVGYNNGSRNRGIYNDEWFRLCEPRGITIRPLP